MILNHNIVIKQAGTRFT